MELKIQEAYENEMRLIEANGGDKKTIQFRFDELTTQKKEFMDSIEIKIFEFSGRMKALSEYIEKLKKE